MSMNIRYIYLLLLALPALAQGAESVLAPVAAQSNVEFIDTPVQQAPRPKKKRRKKRISFNFQDVDLTEIINYLAAEKKVNIILPATPISAKVTLKHQDKLLIDDAFNMLNTLLDVAGYVMTPRGDDRYVITKIDGNTNRETLPVYIGVSPDTLPDSDERVRYLYYFDNIRIPTGGGGQAQELKTILDDMLQEPGKPASSQVLFDANTNSIIITGKAYSIKVAMQIIAELDKTGFREVVEVVKLINTSASFIAKFLMEQLIAPAAAGQQPTTVTPPSFDSSYFSKTVKIIPDMRTNSLIILGRIKAVERLKDFIYKYLDIPLESGESIIHVYELQYLDAQTFAEDLRNIIKPRDTGQAKGSAEERAFEGVIIEAEKTGVIDKLKTNIGDVGDVVQGGNRLIIAAKKSDWLNLKRLIADLDKPQPQVALECLIADVSLETNRFLGSQIRNKPNGLAKNVNTQLANLSNPVLNPPLNPVNLIADLLTFQQDGLNLASRATPGSTILTFGGPNTNGIFWVAQVLQEYTNSKIISHPYVTTFNQTQAKISLAEVRLVTGQAKQNPDGTLTVQQQNLPADITVEILPRINLSNSINLQIAVKVNNFVSQSSSDNTRNTRTFITNATVGNGEILVLGGLVKTNETETVLATPILSKIPLIGWLFKSVSKITTKDSLMVFICPSVIKPHKVGGMSESTVSKYEIAAGQVHEGRLFDQIKDPITRWFFKSPALSIDDMVDDYRTEAFFSERPYHAKLAQPEPPQPGKKRKSRIKRFEQENKNEAIAKQVGTAEDDKLKKLVAYQDNPLKKTDNNKS